MLTCTETSRAPSRVELKLRPWTSTAAELAWTSFGLNDVTQDESNAMMAGSTIMVTPKKGNSSKSSSVPRSDHMRPVVVDASRTNALVERRADLEGPMTKRPLERR